MTGFFNKQQIKSITRPEGKHLSCYSCGLFKDSIHPKMKPYGNFAKGIMCIGEAPNEQEDSTGKTWQGKSGSLLRKTLSQFNIDLEEDCISLNSVNCRPKTEEGKNRLPTQLELNCCARSIQLYISKYKPKIILLFGSTAVQTVIGSKWKKDLGKFTKWVGYTIPDQEYNAWLCPVFTPNYVAHEEKEELTNLWEKDLQKAIEKLNCEFPIYEEPTIHYLKETELSELDNITSDEIAFDYETTGLKPHAIGHQIVCASIAVSENEVYTFPMPKKKSLQLTFLNLLTNPKIKKIGQNIKYEHTWSFYCLGITVSNWIWDTMLWSHILNNKPDTTSLKFQTYINFGIGDYSSEIEPFLQAEDPKNSNSFNTLVKYFKTPENAMKTMRYCALDSINTFRLKKLQEKQIKELI